MRPYQSRRRQQRLPSAHILCPLRPPHRVQNQPFSDRWGLTPLPRIGYRASVEHSREGFLFMRPAPIFTAPRNDVVVEELIDEVLVYDRRGDVAHCLSEIAATVWRTCEGGATLDEVAEQIVARDLAGSSDEAMELADTAVAELVEKGLLETSGVGASRVSRRQALRRMAGVGAAAVVAPLVVSAAVPNSAAAVGSCAGLGVGCFSANSVSNCCPMLYCNNSSVCTTCLPNGDGSPCSADTAYQCCSGICNTTAASPHCVG